MRSQYYLLTIEKLNCFIEKGGLRFQKVDIIYKNNIYLPQVNLPSRGTIRESYPLSANFLSLLMI